MFRFILIFLAISIISTSSFCQDKDIQSLYYQAAKSLELFVIKKPLNNAKYDIDDSTFYSEYLMHSSGQIVDKRIFLEIIQNSKQADTTDWKDEELPNSILVDSPKAIVDINYVLKKFSNKPKEKLRIYKKFATRFNKHFEERRYYLMSRPVFDNAHEYAVLNISNNFYGGMLLSFKKINNEWKELGIIDVWRY